MAVLLKNDVLYLHIPKTGGNWLRKLLRESGCVIRSVGDKHATYDFVAGMLAKRSLWDRWLRPDKYSKLKYLTVVRNPLSWYESWFKYQKARGFVDWGTSGDIRHWHIMSSINSVKHDDFNEFVRAIHRVHPGFVSDLYSAYAARSSAHVLKLEQIRNDVAQINRRFDLGISESAIFAAPEHGVSPRVPISWDNRTFEDTVRLEQAAFCRFGYGCDGVVSVD